MPVLLGHHHGFAAHDPGAAHPERPERLVAVLEGIARAGVAENIVEFAPRPATREELLACHSQGYLETIESACVSRRALDPDTIVGAGSLEAALRAAGAGLDAVERLERGEGSAAFLALRPPGHHARFAQAMGFCLFNNVALTAAALVGRGEKVLVLDWDAHHGNGTQEAFWSEPNVLFVSLHQFPAYPGTGALSEIGVAEGVGATINVPFPAGTGGDAYRQAFDEVLVPAVERFSPSWVLVSAGFDAHRADPLTDLGLSAGDFADLTERALRLSVPGRRIFFLEGGYDLGALSSCAGATVAALCGERQLVETATSSGRFVGSRISDGGTPAAIVSAVKALHESLGDT